MSAAVRPGDGLLNGSRTTVTPRPEFPPKIIYPSSSPVARARGNIPDMWRVYRFDGFTIVSGRSFFFFFLLQRAVPVRP